MNDSSTFNGSMRIYDKTLTVADDIIRALIAALSGKSNEEQKKILEKFSKHLSENGALRAVTFDSERLNAFAAYAKKHQLTYCSTADRVTGACHVIYRDTDETMVQKIADEMRGNGIDPFPNPQKSFSDFCREHPADSIVYQRISSPDQVHLAKPFLASLNVSFALAKNEDSTCIAVFDKKDLEAIQKSGLVEKSAPVSSFNGQLSLTDVRTIVKEKREQEARKQKTRTQNANIAER